MLHSNNPIIITTISSKLKAFLRLSIIYNKTERI